ncbi:MAG: NAD(P)H-hydrate dehydratase [Candidatus Dasytiphilus stammeri]
MQSIITFISIKTVLITTGQARKYVGKLYSHNLDTNVVLNKHHYSISKWDNTCLTEKFLHLKMPIFHKGQHGKLLLIISEVEKDRLQAIPLIVKYYREVVMLKEAGTFIASHSGEVVATDVRNVGLTTGGMGDILSVIIGSLLGQQFSIYKADILG